MVRIVRLFALHYRNAALRLSAPSPSDRRNKNFRHSSWRNFPTVMTQTLSHRLSQARASFKKRQWFALFLRGGLATILILFLAALLYHFQLLQHAAAFAVLYITFAGL